LEVEPVVVPEGRDYATARMRPSTSSPRLAWGPEFVERQAGQSRNYLILEFGFWIQRAESGAQRAKGEAPNVIASLKNPAASGRHTCPARCALCRKPCAEHRMPRMKLRIVGTANRRISNKKYRMMKGGIASL